MEHSFVPIRGFSAYLQLYSVSTGVQVTENIRRSHSHIAGDSLEHLQEHPVISEPHFRSTNLISADVLLVVFCTHQTRVPLPSQIPVVLRSRSVDVWCSSPDLALLICVQLCNPVICHLLLVLAENISN